MHQPQPYIVTNSHLKSRMPARHNHHISPSLSPFYRAHNNPFHLIAFPNLSPGALPGYSTSSRAPEKPKLGSEIAKKSLPHLTQQSNVHQVSVSDKAVTFRRAVAIGHVIFSNPEPLKLIREHSLKKGDVLAVARVAAIMAVKKTGDLIPLAHGGIVVEGCMADVEVVDPHDPCENSFNEKVLGVEPKPDDTSGSSTTYIDAKLATVLSAPIGSYGGIRIAVSVSTTAKTGIEMEALTGVVGAGLTVIDMCKAVDRHLKLEGVEVVGKSGGKSGAWGIYAK